ncbi:MAG TPA: hypothetical protein VF297_32440 [Pyrinomonadaceae bacterium]
MKERHLTGLGRYTSAPHNFPELTDGGHMTFDAHLAGAPVATCSVNAHLVMEVYIRTFFPGYVAGVEEMEREGVDVAALAYQNGRDASAGRAPLTPLTKSLMYLLAHLPAKFDGALADLLSEAAEFARREERLGRGEHPRDINQVVESLLADEAEAARARLESRATSFNACARWPKARSPSSLRGYGSVSRRSR